MLLQGRFKCEQERFRLCCIMSVEVKLIYQLSLTCDMSHRFADMPFCHFQFGLFHHAVPAPAA